MQRDNHVRRSSPRWEEQEPATYDVDQLREEFKARLYQSVPPESFDARVWAESWLRINKGKPFIESDIDTMVAWFANALMAGYDEGGETVELFSHHQRMA